MAETEGEAEIKFFLDLIQTKLGSSAPSVPQEVQNEISRVLIKCFHRMSRLELTNQSLMEEREAKDAEIAVLKAKLAHVRSKNESLKATLNASDKLYNILLQKGNNAG